MIKEIKITIWGREFSLPVRFRCHSDQEITKQQLDSFDWLLKNSNLFEKAKTTVENYCKKTVSADDSNRKKDNVFSYVKPEYFFILRDEDESFSRVMLMLKYKYDLGHGLAVVFDKNGTVKVVPQDEIL